MNKFFHGINMVTSTAARLLPISNQENSVTPISYDLSARQPCSVPSGRNCGPRG
ncbi:unnamed protein product [Penicillium camemberti]|uniref:Str. FM013 n=1 Tax=Penicillium camemberti (strain FM 013) TaxID=1429867 RepID=A0A0G4PR56_PENC3|nr:unnamed protein product [Penicillium camemberti]